MATGLELFEGATQITVGSSITATKASGTEYLYYTFSAVAGTTYQIDVEGVSTDAGTFVDPELDLFYGTTSISLYTSDAGRGVGLNARIHYTRDDNGTAYLRLSDVSPYDAGGSFRLTVSEYTGDDYGDDLNSASPLGFGSTISGNLELPGDSDWFAVDLTAGNTYTFDLAGSSTSAGTLLDPYLKLYNGVSTYPRASDDDTGTGNNASLTYTPTTSGTYYLEAMSGGLPLDFYDTYKDQTVIQVSALNREHTDPGTYTLSVTETGPSTSIPNVTLGVYRFFNSSTGTHFYSADHAEAVSINDTLPSYIYETVAFKSVSSTDTTATEFYRFFNTETGTHFFTASAAERDSVTSTLPQYNYEGVGYYLHHTADSNDIALYRFFNTDTGTHFYTASEIEKDNVISTLSQYNYEGIVGYVDIA